jgi:hypothetical protein
MVSLPYQGRTSLKDTNQMQRQDKVLPNGWATRGLSHAREKFIRVCKELIVILAR